MAIGKDKRLTQQELADMPFWKRMLGVLFWNGVFVGLGYMLHRVFA